MFVKTRSPEMYIYSRFAKNILKNNLFRFLLSTVLTFTVFMTYIFNSCSAEPQKQWEVLVTGVDGGGNEVTTTVFGYYLKAGGYDQVFVVCDPNTGEELGQAYIPGGEVGQKDVLDRINRNLKEDESAVKQIVPVSIRLLAPNVYNNLGRTDYSWEQYEKTGNMYDVASGVASWPGPTSPYIIPGDDPNYWLIVAEVINPNPWPVKANVDVSLEKWRDSSWDTGGNITFEKEVDLGANEIKYLLVNKGRNPYYDQIYDDSDWNGSLYIWSEANLHGKVTENNDPELPDRLKANLGYITFTDYPGSPPEPNDLSGGIPEGTPLDEGPYKNLVNAVGPAIVGYTNPIDTGRTNKISSGGNSIPVLKYAPIFIEYWRFEPVNGKNDEGRLVKEMVPGYSVIASSLSRPYFNMTSKLNNYNVSYYKAGSGKYPYWVYELTFNRHITVTGYGSNCGVTFYNIPLADINIFKAVYEIDEYLEGRLGANVDILEPDFGSDDYNPILINLGTVTLNPGETKLYEGDVVTKILIRDPAAKWGTESGQEDHDAWIPRDDIDSVINEIKDYFDWSGEPAFVGNGNVSFKSDIGGLEQVFSLNVAEYEREEGSWDDVGLVEADYGEWLGANSYFVTGLCLRPEDMLWMILNSNRTLSANTFNYDNPVFWDTLYYDYKGNYWGFNRAFWRYN